MYVHSSSVFCNAQIIRFRITIIIYNIYQDTNSEIKVGIIQFSYSNHNLFVCIQIESIRDSRGIPFKAYLFTTEDTKTVQHHTRGREDKKWIMLHTSQGNIPTALHYTCISSTCQPQWHLGSFQAFLHCQQSHHHPTMPQQLMTVQYKE